MTQQQHAFITSQLPTYSFRLITGADNAEYWSSKAVWDAALLNQNGVVSTPQVLLNALKHAFFPLSIISLLVFDEAHHCIRDHPYNKIMTLAYHPIRAKDANEVPHILGLTASPMIRDDLSLISELERNMDAVCRSPTVTLDQYKSFTNVSELVWLPYTVTTCSRSLLVPLIEDLVSSYALQADPTFIKLRQRTSDTAEERLARYLENDDPPVLWEMKDLLKKAAHMADTLGSWATDRYIVACIDKLLLSVQTKQDCLLTIEHDEQTMLGNQLRPLQERYLSQPPGPVTESNTTPQVSELVDFLRLEYRDSMASVVFVQRRSSAYALCDILGHIDSLNQYRCFVFVGSSNPLRRHLTELADYGQQQKAFADFRAGRQNVCIATQVLEEGIDVQACNLVISFDLPATNKSYIQRRGRARHKDAKFVMMHPEGMPPSKYRKWVELEAEMKRLYSEKDRARQELSTHEARLSDDDPDQPLRHNQAIVEEADARQKLEYFCATMKRYGEAPSSPVYILHRSMPGFVTCTVHLPQDLPAELRTLQSLRPRSTEAAAKRGAAFQAYKILHQAGLLNEHLLPIHAEGRARRGQRFQAIETRSSTVEAAETMKPWNDARALIAGASQLYASQILVSGLPKMLLLMPDGVPQPLSCRIHTISQGVLHAQVVPLPGPCSILHSHAAAVTRFLFRFVLGRRLPGIEKEDFRLPYYVVPDLGPLSLGEWLHESQQSAPVKGFNFNVDTHEFVINQQHEQMPYFYTAAESTSAPQSTRAIGVVRLHRTIDFTTTSCGERAQPIHRTPPEDQCTVSSMGPGYVRVMAYIPTIMHTVEMALRVEQARIGPLRSIFSNRAGLLDAAFTAPGAGNPSYQRLEYIGDVILKFMATVNVFCNNPAFSEGALSVAMDRIVNNARLHRSTLDLGLHVYLATEPFSASAWTLASQGDGDKRKLSTKTLADLIEALLGVAYTGGLGDDFTGVAEALQLFIPEISWYIPVADVAKVKVASLPTDLNTVRFADVQDMLGYRFQHLGLLAEALNHSSTSTTLRSYDRLEFLGDAIIDLLVKRPLYNSPHHFSEEYMTLARHALVDKETFAFLATLTRREITEQTPTVDLRTKVVRLEPTVKPRHLHDYLARTPSQDLARQRSRLLVHYDEVCERVSTVMWQGKVWPWADLLRLDSPKWASDVLESLIGAVFVDSGADLKPCELVLERLGLMQMVHRVARDGDVEFRQARERVRMEWPGRVRLESARYRADDDDDDDDQREGEVGGADSVWLWRCEVLVDGNVVGSTAGASCVAEAEERAARVALASDTANARSRARVSKKGGGGGKRGGVVRAHADRGLDAQDGARKRARVDDDDNDDVGGDGGVDREEVDGEDFAGHGVQGYGDGDVTMR